MPVLAAVKSSYLIHVAGYNLGLIMRLLTGVGTPPRGFRPGCSVWLFAVSPNDGSQFVKILVVTGDQCAALAFIITPNPSG
jgi:hypothetical protein